MAKKLPDEECRANYLRLRELFDAVVSDHDRFEVVYACGVDVGMIDAVVVRVSTYTYASYAVGFDRAANEIVIVPVTVDLNSHGTPIYLKNSEIQKAKQGFMTKEITIQDKRLPKKYIQLNVQEMINQDPDGVVLLHKQTEEAKHFLDFFKNQYRK